MPAYARSPSPYARLIGTCLLAAALLSGCASWPGRQAPRVSVVGLEPAAGQGLEARFELKLRVQNPSDAAISYDGVVLDLDLNGQPFASGVSDQRGSIPRLGEAILTVPVTVSAVSALRQARRWLDGQPGGALAYRLNGRLAGGMLGGTRFSDEGELALPGAAP
ncbi:LEA type 2 family protein [Orrella sp. JC864]|uniref:LEA type 2 family protein n=1 Tax=Orrella sp. JC864 TaxID=3120298 RepID=UPI00300BB141